MNRIFGWLFALVGLVALFAAGLFLGSPEEAQADDGGPPAFVVPVTLTTVARGDVEPQALLSGTVRAARRAQLGFDTGGLVVELTANEADAVAAETLLARLEAGDQEHELTAARASLALARRQHELLQAGEREEEKKRLQAVRDAARAETELARLEVQRGEKLLADRIIAQSEQDTRVSAFDAADQRRAAAEQELAAAIAGTRVEDLAVSAARIDEAQARVDAALYALARTELRAPWPGSIVQRFVSTGDYLAAGDPVVELVDLDNLEVHVEIPGRFASRVRSGAAVRLLPGPGEEALERTLDATIAAADEAARSFRGIIRFASGDSHGGLLRPGMFVGVELALEPVRGELVVASDAVLASERGRHVVRAREVPDPSGGGGPPGLVAEFVPVEVLAEADDGTAVRGELTAGDRIVLVGADNAFPGASLLAQPSAGGEAGAAPGPEATE